MKNPWTKKNPFMSMWLSGANTVIGKARGHASAAVKREANKAVASATTSGAKQVADFWTKALTPGSTTRRRRKP